MDHFKGVKIYFLVIRKINFYKEKYQNEIFFVIRVTKETKNAMKHWFVNSTLMLFIKVKIIKSY